MGKANKHKLFNKEAAKAYGGSLKHFIKTIPPKKKPGRPPKKSKGRGRPPRKSTPDVMNADRTVAAATVATVDNEVEEVEDKLNYVCKHSLYSLHRDLVFTCWFIYIFLRRIYVG